MYYKMGFKKKRLVQTEAGIRDQIAKELNGQIEIATPVGRIDILTNTLLNRS
jgi:hypothetical protein